MSKNTLPFVLVASLIAAVGVRTASSAEDDAVPAAKPAADTPSEESDAKARAVLAKAAERQNASDLAKLESFHVVFRKAKFQREKRNAEGVTTTQEVETDEDGLAFLWKEGSIRTDVTIDGSTTKKAWYEPLKIGWFNDGTKTSSLLGAEHKTDYDQLQFHRTIVNQILDLVILDKLLKDGSRWRVVEDDKSHEKAVAIVRTPPADAVDAAPVTLWVENPSEGVYGDVIAASMPPKEPGGTTMLYDFAYLADAPTVRVKTADAEPAASTLRFPFRVTVSERKSGGDEVRKVLEVFTRSVDLNTVTDEDFAQPKSSPK